jgi:hypothetical protein
MRCLRAWLGAAGTTEGAVFRSVRKSGRHIGARLSDRLVCELVKSYAAQIGLDASKFGAHSLGAS